MQARTNTHHRLHFLEQFLVHLVGQKLLGRGSPTQGLYVVKLACRLLMDVQEKGHVSGLELCGGPLEQSGNQISGKSARTDVR